MIMIFWSCSRWEATVYCIIHTRHYQLKTDWHQNNKIKIDQCSKKLVKYKDTVVLTILTLQHIQCLYFDVCWGSLGTSIFGKSSLVAYNTLSKLPSRLSFRFLWLWKKPKTNRLKKPFKKLRLLWIQFQWTFSSP